MLAAVIMFHGAVVQKPWILGLMNSFLLLVAVQKPGVLIHVYGNNIHVSAWK